MNKLHLAQTGEPTLPIGESGSSNTPPLWHRMEVAPMMLRSLHHDSSETAEHTHDGVELILNFGAALGAIVWRDADGLRKTAELREDDCCMIPAGVPHILSGLRAHGVVSLLVGGVIIAELAKRNLTAVVVGNLRKLTAHDAMAVGLVADFSRVVLRHPQVLLVNTLGFALALKLLHSILYLNVGYSREPAPFCPSERQRTLEFLTAHLAERVTVSTMAQKLGLSRAHFTRRFHATFGMPPLRYALKMRVDRALELLRGGEYRVAEAALAVGFCDQSHLDRHCRKFYGRAPSAMLRD